MKLFKNRLLCESLVVILCFILILSFGGCSVLKEVVGHESEYLTELSTSEQEISANIGQKDDVILEDEASHSVSDENEVTPDTTTTRNGFYFESGDLKERSKTFSSTYLDGEKLCEIRYRSNQVETEVFPNFNIQRDYILDCIDVKFHGNTYNYVVSAKHDIENVSFNSNKIYTYEYRNQNLFRFTDHRTTYAYEIGFDEAGNATSRTMYIYANNTYYKAITQTYAPLPDSVVDAVSITDTVISPVLSERTVVAGGQTRNVIFQDGVVVSETVSDETSEKEVVYINDVYGNKLGFILDGTKYYYVYNIIGDVTDVLTDTGAIAASYSYDNIGAVVSVTGPQAETIRKYNAFAYRAWDDWYFNNAGNFYDVGGGIIYYPQYAKFRNLSGTDFTFGDFIKNPARYSIRDGQSVYSNSKKLVPDTEKQIRDKVVRQVGLGLKNNGITNLTNVPVLNYETDKLQSRAEIYTLNNANNQNHAAGGQIYLVTPNEADEIEYCKSRMSSLTNGSLYVNDGIDSVIPARGMLSAKGHFVIANTYVQYQSDSKNAGIILYDTFPNDPDNYVVSYGNLYNYDTGNYEIYSGEIDLTNGVEIIGNVIYEFDYDAVMADYFAYLDEVEAFQSYEIEDCEAQYLSWETIEEIERCERGNLIMNGMTYDELFEYYDGDLDFTYVNGSLVQTSTLPKEDPIDWKNFFIKLGVGVGVILIATTVTVVTGGTAAPIMCFLATTAKLGAMAVVGGAVGASVEYAVTGDENAALQGFADGFSFTALIASTAAIGGVIPSLCFPAGTPVHTLNGILPIESVAVGDFVLSYNEATGRQEYQEVVELYRNQAEQLVNLTVNGEQIQATPSHPFYIPNVGWVSAKDLKVGFPVLNADGTYSKIQAVEIANWNGDVYNFQVADNHNYYVGNKGVLVHNTCEAAIGAELSGSSSSSGIIEGLKGGSIIAGAGEIAGAISSNQPIVLSSENTHRKILSKENVSKLCIPSLGDKVYQIAYVPKGSQTQELFIQPIYLNYLEAITVLYFAGLYNDIQSHLKDQLVERTDDMNNLIGILQNQNFNKNRKIYGIYTATELDAAKLAYATPANILDDTSIYAEYEIHTYKDTIGYYFHFHDADNNFHIWFGTKHFKEEF